MSTNPTLDQILDEFRDESIISTLKYDNQRIGLKQSQEELDDAKYRARQAFVEAIERARARSEDTMPNDCNGWVMDIYQTNLLQELGLDERS